MENIWFAAGGLITALLTIAGSSRAAYARISPVVLLALIGFFGFAAGSFWSADSIRMALTGKLSTLPWLTPQSLADIANVIDASMPLPMLMPALCLLAVHVGITFAFDISPHANKDGKHETEYPANEK